MRLRDDARSGAPCPAAARERAASRALCLAAIACACGCGAQWSAGGSYELGGRRRAWGEVEARGATRERSTIAPWARARGGGDRSFGIGLGADLVAWRPLAAFPAWREAALGIEGLSGGCLDVRVCYFGVGGTRALLIFDLKSTPSGAISLGVAWQHEERFGPADADLAALSLRWTPRAEP